MSADRRRTTAARAALVGLVLALAVSTLAGALGAAAVVAGTTWGDRRRRAAARRAVEEQLPDVVDLLRLSLAAGLSPRTAIERVGAGVGGPLGEWCSDVARRAGRGVALERVLRDSSPAGHPVAGLARLLASAEVSGVPLGPALERLAAEHRAAIRRAALERARRLPVLLLLPLVTCTLPAFVLVSVVPWLSMGFDRLS